MATNDKIGNTFLLIDRNNEKKNQRRKAVKTSSEIEVKV